MSTLKNLVNNVEFTDEIVSLNKQHQTLNSIYEKISELQELFDTLKALNTTCLNAEVQMIAKKFKKLDIVATQKSLALILEGVSGESFLSSAKVNELLNFQKLSNALFIYKEIKNNP